MNPPPVATREIAREERFNVVWTQELNDVPVDRVSNARHNPSAEVMPPGRYR